MLFASYGEGGLGDNHKEMPVTFLPSEDGRLFTWQMPVGYEVIYDPVVREAEPDATLPLWVADADTAVYESPWFWIAITVALALAALAIWWLFIRKKHADEE